MQPMTTEQGECADQRPGSRGGRRRITPRHGIVYGADRGGWDHRDPELMLLTGEPSGCLGAHGVQVGAAGSDNRRGKQALDERGGAGSNPSAYVLVEHLQREVRGQHRAADVHQDDDAVACVRRGDGMQDCHRVGAESGLVQSCGHLDRQRTGHHLPNEGDCGLGQCAAV